MTQKKKPTKKDVQKHMPDPEELARELASAEAIDDLNNMRNREGINIAEDMAKRIDYIERSLIQIKDKSDDLLDYYQKRLKERIGSLTKGIVELEPARIAQEAAFLADKSDISEEIIRVESHLEQFREISKSEDSSGRKLNFLLQESIAVSYSPSKDPSDDITRFIIGRQLAVGN